MKQRLNQGNNNFSLNNQRKLASIRCWIIMLLRKKSSNRKVKSKKRNKIWNRKFKNNWKKNKKTNKNKKKKKRVRSP